MDAKKEEEENRPARGSYLLPPVGKSLVASINQTVRFACLWNTRNDANPSPCFLDFISACGLMTSSTILCSRKIL